MIYRTQKDYPGMPQGEILVLDESNPNAPVYRGAKNPKLWMAKEVVETNETPIVEIPIEKPTTFKAILVEELSPEDALIVSDALRAITVVLPRQILKK